MRGKSSHRLEQFITSVRGDQDVQYVASSQAAGSLQNAYTPITLPLHMAFKLGATQHSEINTGGHRHMGMNRRRFLQWVGVGAAGTAVLSAPVVQALASPALPDVLRRPAAAPELEPVTHLLNRLTFGPRPGQVEAVRRMGIPTFIEQQLNPDEIADDASEARLGNLITLDMLPIEMFSAGKLEREVMYELISATVLRAVYSERQLLEVMVNFWSEHFSIYHPKEACGYLKTVDDREVIRKHALGKFRDLLHASAQSPAMLVYLDNADSRKEHPNENYARELMELHTLTVGHYTEQDVKEVARCFTGWTVGGRRSPQVGLFTFQPRFHDDDEKRVLGRVIAAGGGVSDATTVLDMLAAHPATAKHIASKLCRRFIADDPPATVVEAVAQVFLATDGDIKHMLRVIFASPEFLNAPPKFKRPFEYTIGLARALDAEVRVPVRLRVLESLKQMGHLPFDWPAPNGYSDYASEWIDSLLLRWNLAIAAVSGQWRGVRVDALRVAYQLGARQNAREVVAVYARHLLGRDLAQAEHDAIWGFVTRNGEPNLRRLVGRNQVLDAIALIAASPAYQYR